MPSCPNCGRKTLRTLDWACQWCGYPLLSKSYKRIDKTFKELQEERNITASPVPPEEAAPDYTPEIETEPEPAYQPSISEKPIIELETPSVPELEPEPEPEIIPELPPPAVKPTGKRKTRAAAKPEKKSSKKSGTIKEPAPEAESAPEPMITPPPAAATEPMITPPPTPEPAPEPPPVTVPKIETLVDGDLLTVDGLDALFRENKIATHTALTDKTVKIQGITEKIFIRDHIDVRYIVLKGTQKKLLWPVRCTFGKEAVTDMYRLSEGQEVIIQGKYDGYGKNIIFKDCTIVS